MTFVSITVPGSLPAGPAGLRQGRNQRAVHERLFRLAFADHDHRGRHGLPPRTFIFQRSPSA